MLAFSNAGVSVEKSDHSFEVMWKVLDNYNWLTLHRSILETSIRICDSAQKIFPPSVGHCGAGALSPGNILGPVVDTPAQFQMVNEDPVRPAIS